MAVDYIKTKCITILGFVALEVKLGCVVAVQYR